MKVDDVRKIVAAQAIEQSDTEGRIWNDSDKREAAAIAGAPLPKDLSKGSENAFLAERAELLLVRASSRSSEAMRWFRHPANRHRFGWFSLGLCIIAVLIGLWTNELGPEKRINILSFPLLGIILWSFAVYLREIALFFRNRNQLFHDGWIDGLLRFLQPGSESPTHLNESDEDATLSSAENLFQSRWRELTAPVTGARLKAMLHFVAFLLALAAILGMYLKGLAIEYRAVWESTFFTDSESLRPFLKIVLGPASILTGGEIPTSAQLDSMHWKAGADQEIAGENAARWIHWYAITIGIYVLIPRALLSLLWKWKAGRVARTLAFREISPPYYDHLLATSSGTALKIRLVPYAIDLDESVRQATRNTLETHYERPVEITWMPTIPFGEEEEASLPEGDSEEPHLLFNFASTPEKETHLTLVQTLLAGGANPVESGSIKRLLLDTTTFDEKGKSFPDSEKRRRDREAAWRYLLEGTSVEPIFFSKNNPYRGSESRGSDSRRSEPDKITS